MEQGLTDARLQRFKEIQAKASKPRSPPAISPDDMKTEKLFSKCVLLQTEVWQLWFRLELRVTACLGLRRHKDHCRNGNTSIETSNNYPTVPPARTQENTGPFIHGQTDPTNVASIPGIPIVSKILPMARLYLVPLSSETPTCSHATACLQVLQSGCRQLDFSHCIGLGNHDPGF